MTDENKKVAPEPITEKPEIALKKAKKAQKKLLFRYLGVLEVMVEQAKENALISAEPEAAAKQQVTHYNRLFELIAQHVPEISSIFSPLSADATLDVVGFAAQQLLAYLAPLRSSAKQKGKVYETILDLGPFQLVMGQDFKDLRGMRKLLGAAKRRHARMHRHMKGHFHPNHRPGHEFDADFMHPHQSTRPSLAW